MNREANIARFEAELDKVQRPGMGLLLEYIRHSDFYTAPASTKYHLSCEGGLLQHSLNVLDALRGLLMKEPDGKDEAGNPKVKYHYVVADKFVATFPQDSVIITALLHDICKTFFYTTSTRNAKNEKTGKWEKVPYYTVEDKMPLGHGGNVRHLVAHGLHREHRNRHGDNQPGHRQAPPHLGAAHRRYDGLPLHGGRKGQPGCLR